MKPIHKEFHETVRLGDEVTYDKKRCTIIGRHRLTNGLIVLSLEADDCIYCKIPDWLVSPPKYKLADIV